MTSVIDPPAEVEPKPEGTGPEPEPAVPREKREYVVLVAEKLTPVEPTPEDDPPPFWGELGTVEAFNRAGAIEEVERRWPAALEGDDVKLHLIPARFWQEITPEEQPPPPPRRKWKGVG